VDSIKKRRKPYFQHYKISPQLTIQKVLNEHVGKKEKALRISREDKIENEIKVLNKHSIFCNPRFKLR